MLKKKDRIYNPEKLAAKKVKREKKKEDLNYITWVGSICQAFVIVIFIYRCYWGLLFRSASAPVWIDNLSWVMMILALLAQVRIYIIPYFQKKIQGKTTGLITTDLFKYTRHPMYTFLVLADITANILYQDLLIMRIPQMIGFYALLALAAYLHEQEMVVQFGKEAEEYYARTPRIFLWYPFMKRTK